MSSGSKRQHPTLRNIYGCNKDVNGNLHFLSEVSVMYPSGHGVVILNTETNSQSFLPCAVSTHKITAMAMSSKRIAAIAETADHAFVTLYNVDKRKKINTLKMPDCETVVSAAFSSDGKYLLTQGGAPTWSIVCWSVEKGKPVANTVTNTDAYKQVANVSFHPEDSDVFCVSGNGVLKFFRIGDNTIKMISNGLHKREPQNFKSHTFLTKGSLVASTGMFTHSLTHITLDNHTLISKQTGTMRLTWRK